MKANRVLFTSALIAAGCQRADPTPTAEAQLPPATQTGANTFGCLLNGQAFTPNGSDGNGGSPFIVVYDPTFGTGSLTVYAFRHTVKGDESTRQVIGMFLDSMRTRGAGRYALTIPRHREAQFVDYKTNCHFYSGEPHFRKGTLTLTRVDGQAGIIAGTFEFTLYKPGCDSVIVTKGRFDKKL